MEGKSCNRNQGIIARVYVKARTRLISRSRSYGVSKEDAEDQIQDLFVSILEGKITCSSDDEVTIRQLTRMQQNDAIDHFRTALRRRRLLAEAQSMRSSEVVSSPSTAVQVDQLLDRLPPDQEKAVVWNIVWGKTAAEIAEAAGTSPNTVSSRVVAALRAMAFMAVPLALLYRVRDVLSLLRRLLGGPRARIVVVLGVSGILLLCAQIVPPPAMDEVAGEMKTGPFPSTGLILRHLVLHPPDPPKPKDVRVSPKDSHAFTDDGSQRKSRVRSAPAPRTKTAEKIPGEGDLIARAMECLHSAPSLAEAALKEHKRLYPKGRLATERDVLLQQLANTKAANQRDAE